MPVKASISVCRRLPIKSAPHGEDTTLPILAKGKTNTGRIWTYVRDDRPFGGQSPPVALYYSSRDRRQEHPERHLKSFTGILQADAYGYNPVFKVDRDPAPLRQALCWAHSRRKFFVLADIATNAKRGSRAAPISQMALEAVSRVVSITIAALRARSDELCQAVKFAVRKTRRERRLLGMGLFDGVLFRQRVSHVSANFLNVRHERLHPIAHLDGDDRLGPVEPTGIVRINFRLLIDVRLRPGDNCRDVLHPQRPCMPAKPMACSTCSGEAALSFPSTVGPTARSTRICL